MPDRDWEYYAYIPEHNLEVYISTVGGGTVGRSYANNDWEYQAQRDGDVIAAGRDLRSGGAAKTHADMAKTLAEFLTA